ncbi:hypothetical protein pdam_00010410, partial [Pocillopora damicornis]
MNNKLLLMLPAISEAKSTTWTCDGNVEVVLKLSCEALAHSLPVDEGELLKDLNKNFMVKKELSMIVYRFSLNYGKYMAITVLFFSLSIMLNMRHIPQKNLIRTWQCCGRSAAPVGKKKEGLDNFSDFYKARVQLKPAEMIYVGAAAFTEELVAKNRLFLCHDKLWRRQKDYKYALTVGDIVSRYKDADPLTPQDSSEVSKASQPTFKRSSEWVKRPPEFVSALNHE